MELGELSHGDTINISFGNGRQRTFDVFIGDALLKGKEEQIWLKSVAEGKSVYLRKLPQKPLSVGIALFTTKTELEHTLNSGSFYIA